MTKTSFTHPPRRHLIAVAVLALIVGGLAGAGVQRWLLAHPGAAQAHADEPAHSHQEGHQDGHRDEHADDHKAGQDDEHKDGLSAPLDAAQLARMGVRLESASPKPLGGGDWVSAELGFNEERRVQLTPRLGGEVLSVAVRPGDRVTRGQVLAVLHSPALAELRAQDLAARRRLELARAQEQREQGLWQAKVAAEQDYLQARLARQEAEIAAELTRQKLQALGATAPDGAAALARYELRAPQAGVVTERRLSVGEVVREDSAVLQLAELSSLWVHLALPGTQLAGLKPGQRLAVRALDAAPGAAPLQATLLDLGQRLGEQSRSASVRLLLDRVPADWRAGQAVQVELPGAVAQGAAVLAVPLAALQQLEGRDTLFVLQADARVAARPVRLGRRVGEQVEVLEGLRAGERYVAQNSFLIKAELGKSGAAHEH